MESLDSQKLDGIYSVSAVFDQTSMDEETQFSQEKKCKSLNFSFLSHCTSKRGLYNMYDIQGLNFPERKISIRDEENS